MRKLLPLMVVACVAVAVSASPAMASSAHAAKKAPSNSQLNKSLKKVKKTVKALGATVATLTSDDKSTAATLKTITDGVPAIVNGLTALKDGLTTLAAAYKAVEYGVLHVVINGAGTNLADMPNQFSSDIPDDGNGAQVSGSLPFTAPNLGIGNYTITLKTRAAIRTAESDGQETGDPVGEVGGATYAVCGSAAVSCGAPPGTVMCVPAQTSTHTFSLPDGSTTTQRLTTIQRRTERTDQSRPSDDVTDPFTQDANDGNACVFTAVPGATYVVTTAYQFFDLPTSLTPGATD